MKSAFIRLRCLKYFVGFIIFLSFSQFHLRLQWSVDMERGRTLKHAIQSVAFSQASKCSRDCSRDSVFSERRNLISETCETYANLTDNQYKYYSEESTVIVGENKSFVYCAVAKASSSFWRHVLSIIEFGKHYSSLYKWYKMLPRLQEYRSVHAIPEIEKFLETATHFLFVREPYGRLFSAYNDKLFRPNILFWRGTGRKVVKTVRTNFTTDNNSDIGYNVTFAELIKFLVLRAKSDKRINEHFAPMYSGCNPCGRKGFYVGKLETFAADSSFIISKLDINADYNRLLQRDVTKSAAYDAQDRAKALFKVLNATQQLPYPRYKLFLRTWRNFQIRGLLSKAYEMPLSERQVMNITQNQFEKVLKFALAKPVNKTLVKLQRREALLQAYSTVPRDLLQDLAEYVEIDCALFGYDKEPRWLFEAANTVQNPSFNYFDIL